MKTKKLLSLFLSMVMVLGILPQPTFATNRGINDSFKTTNLIAKTQFAVAPGISEYELITNNNELTEQQVGHVMEIDLTNPYTEIKVGYSDYNMTDIKNQEWAMTKPTFQAEAAENALGVNIVAAMNASGYNMTNGRPGGTMIMGGNIIKQEPGTVFWIDAEKKAHISSSDEAIAGGAVEALAAMTGTPLVKNGEKVNGHDKATTNPRSAVGIRADGTVVFYMVNGRQAPFSNGLTLDALADMMVELGCEIAINLDGGGSSSFATQRSGDVGNDDIAGLTMRCRPSDGYERSVANSLLVVSTAEQSGIFESANILPKGEIYTPRSQVKFTAQGVDAGGGAANLPDGLIWSLTEDSQSMGTIDANTGAFVANETCGIVNVELKLDNTVVGTGSIEIQKPDKLSFDNSSVSLKFGETSNLSFTPTYKGRTVNYKDGDFKWSLDVTSFNFSHIVGMLKVWGGEISFAVEVDEFAKKDDTYTVQRLQSDGVKVYYEAQYNLSNIEKKAIEGKNSVTGKFSFIDGTAVDYKYNADGTITKIPRTPQLAEAYEKYRETTFDIDLGTFDGNTFVAPTDASMMGKITVSYHDSSVVSENPLEIAVGVAPKVFMDFEDHTTENGAITPAEEYWKIVNWTDGQFYPGSTALDEMKYKLWCREAAWSKTEFKEGIENSQKGSGTIYHASMIDESNGPVRFGEHAGKIEYDMTEAKSTVGIGFGFTDDIPVGKPEGWNIDGVQSTLYKRQSSIIDDLGTTQPTGIGAWINIPKEYKDQPIELKAIVYGGARYFTSAKDSGYPQGNKAGDAGLTGTVTYQNYYSYDSQGNITGKTFKDWAGKGWTWVQCDLAQVQMPLDLGRGYSFRVVLPTSAEFNDVKGLCKGEIYFDNLQFLYGNNPNDTVNPIIDGITETTGGLSLESDGSTVLNSTSLNFEATFSDPTGPYSTGIDPSSVRVYMDSVDITDKRVVDNPEIPYSESNVRIANLWLPNGQHTISVRIKDYFGNETTIERRFTVAAEGNQAAAVDIIAKPSEKAALGQDYTLDLIANEGADVSKVILTMNVNVDFRKTVKSVISENYDTSFEETNGKIIITATKKAEASSTQAIASVIFTIPDSLREGVAFEYDTVCAYTVGENTYTSTTDTTVVPIQAALTVTSDAPLFKQEQATFKVSDVNGTPVKDAVVSWIVNGVTTQLGTTNEEGKVTAECGAPDKIVVYAKKDTKQSYQTTFVIYDLPLTQNPTNVMQTATVNPSTSMNITWMSNAKAEGVPTVNLYSDAQCKNKISTITGSSEVLYFTEHGISNAILQNTVVLKDLSAGQPYYYHVGNGAVDTQKIYQFTLPTADDAQTNFFILGDVQTSNTTNLSKALSLINQDNRVFDFGVQLGDLVDGTTSFHEWNASLSALSADKQSEIITYVTGNHEYNGDDGSLAGAILNLPESKAGTYYSAEYGQVFVAVLNDTLSNTAILDKLKEDALQSNCEWKILITHRPVYSIKEDTSNLINSLAPVLEEAGFDFVFAGHDHAYGRTKPLITDKENKDGIVYYICGDMSGKNYGSSEQYMSKFEKSILHAPGGYDGMYMTVEADANKMQITAYSITGEQIDQYTKYNSPCAESGKHTYTEHSNYNLTDKTLSCTVCNQKIPVKDSGYTGLATIANTENKVYINNGTVMTGWFPHGEEMWHAAADGTLHKTVTTDTSTCTEDGRITASCACGETFIGKDVIWAKGHTWDENHVCTVCGTKGIDIANAELKIAYNYYAYTGSQIRPSSSATYDGRKLVAYSDRRGRDAYISYGENKNVGTANVTYEGRGDFYGSITETFTISPKGVDKLWVEDNAPTSITLQWDAAPGAQEYLVRQENENGEWPVVKTVTGTSCVIENLSGETQYRFKINTRTMVDGKPYHSITWSPIVTATTEIDLTTKTYTYVTDISQTVISANNTTKVSMQMVDGIRFLYLPSFTDETKVTLDLTLTNPDLVVTLKGNLGALELNPVSQMIDFSKLSSKVDGVYTVSVSVPNCAPFTLKVMKSSSIRTMYFKSDDQENHGRDFVEAVKGNSATATMVLNDKDGNIIYDGALTQLKARGNSTFLHYDKKAYQIKLAEKTDLLGVNESVKTWVLLANYGDATQMHDKLFKDLADELGMPYTANCDWVDLYYDGEYRGTYLLSEKNSIGSAGIDITDMEDAYKVKNPNYGDAEETATATNSHGQTYQYTKNLQEVDNITGGYMIELNHNFLDEASGFHTKQGVAFNVKNPEWAGNDAMKYISEYYQAFEDAVYAKDAQGNHTGYNENTKKYYYDYCDLNSLVKVFLMQELALNPDGFKSSFYFYKDVDGKMYAGPIWDLDMALGTGWTKEISPKTVDYHYLAKALIQIPGFKDAVKAYYTNTFSDKVSALIGENGYIEKTATKLSDSLAMNYSMWPLVKIGNPEAEGHLWVEGTHYTDVVAEMTEWIKARKVVLDDNFKVETPPAKPDHPSSGGGSITPPTPKPEPPKTEGGETKVDVSVKPITKGEIATATVKAETVDKALEAAVEAAKKNDTKPTVEIKVEAPSKATEVNATLPTKSFQSLNENGVTLNLSTPVGDIALPAEVLEEISKTAGGKDVTVSVKSLKAEHLSQQQKATLGENAKDATIIDLSMMSNGNKLSTLGGTAKISVPYTTKADEKHENLVVWFLADDGTISPCEGKYNAKTGSFDFETTHFSAYVVTEFPFKDIPQTAWYYGGAAYCYTNKLMGGTSETTFAPNVVTSRAMLATVLYRMSGETPVNYAMAFTDVPADMYYTEAVRWAASKKIVGGYTEQIFAPNDNLTREQMVTMLWRYAGSPDLSDYDGLSKYSDLTEVSPWALNAMKWANKNGIVGGTSDTTLSPKGTATRAQFAVIMQRFMSK